MSEPLVTAREVGELLGVSTETILRWTRRGELPAIRLPGGAIRFRSDALEAWITERATLRASLTATRPAIPSGNTTEEERNA